MAIKGKISFGAVAGIGACALAAGCLVFSASSCLTTWSGYSSTMSDLNQQISAQQVKLDDASSAEVLTVGEAADSAEAAEAAGEKVAELQNSYIGAASDGIAGIAQSLSPFFDSDSQKGRTPWFSYATDDGQGHAVKWSFGTVTGVGDASAGDLDVIWVCRYEGTDTVLAYVTATYDADAETFASPDVHLTSAGNAAVSASSLENAGAQNAGSSSTSTIDELVEQLRSLNDDAASE